jgi:hypothetical protein
MMTDDTLNLILKELREMRAELLGVMHELKTCLNGLEINVAMLGKEIACFRKEVACTG